MASDSIALDDTFAGKLPPQKRAKVHRLAVRAGLKEEDGLSRIGVYRRLAFTIAAIIPAMVVNAQSGTIANPAAPSTNLVPVPSTSSFGVQSRTPSAPAPFPSQAPSYSTTPSTRAPQINAPPTPLAQPSLGSPQADPYSTRGTPTLFPGLFSRPANTSQPGLFGGGFAGSTPPAGAVAFPTQPQPIGGVSPYAGAPYSGSAPYPAPSASPYPVQPYGGTYGTGTYPSSVYPSGTPNVLMPGGVNLPQWNTPNWSLPSLGLPSLGAGGLAGWNQQGTLFNNPGGYRFLQGPRFKHTWLYGDIADGAGPNFVAPAPALLAMGSDLEIHSSEASVAFAFPNFMGGTQPLYILPSFGLHLFNGGGERDAANPNGFLDGKYYDAFIEAGWQSDPNRILGLELGAQVGLFTNFNDIDSDSLRGLGLAQIKLRLTPATTLKFGAAYVDRIEVGLLPVGGILWQPTPNQRYDIYFPKPKLARYLTTVGLQDVWGYIGGEFGGGSWYFSNGPLGSGGQFDYRDLRVTLGLEWGLNHLVASGRRTGFFEAGYVFDREVIIRNPTLSPTGLLSSGNLLDDTFMFRAGIGY